jgi:hypothetical protein
VELARPEVLKDCRIDVSLTGKILSLLQMLGRVEVLNTRDASTGQVVVRINLKSILRDAVGPLEPPRRRKHYKALVVPHDMVLDRGLRALLRKVRLIPVAEVSPISEIQAPDEVPGLILTPH